MREKSIPVITSWFAPLSSHGLCEKCENNKKKTKQSLFSLITRPSVACPAYPTVHIEKRRSKHDTQTWTKLPHTAKKIKERHKLAFLVIFFQRQNSTRRRAETCLHIQETGVCKVWKRTVDADGGWWITDRGRRTAENKWIKMRWINYCIR